MNKNTLRRKSAELLRDTLIAYNWRYGVKYTVVYGSISAELIAHNWYLCAEHGGVVHLLGHNAEISAMELERLIETFGCSPNPVRTNACGHALIGRSTIKPARLYSLLLACRTFNATHAT